MSQSTIPENLRRQGKAQSAVAKALKLGILVRPEKCELCGESPESRTCQSYCIKPHKRSMIQAHHWRGYDDAFILDILWVCVTCNLTLRGARYHDGSLSREELKAIVMERKRQKLAKVKP